MGDKTGISWTDATWNPVRGCSRVSEGCRNCYAERVAARFSGPGQPYEGLARIKTTIANNEERDPGNRRSARWTGEVRLIPEHLADPLRWKKPRRVFVNSMSDLFHESLTNKQIAAVFGVMAAAPQHTFQVLTKRAKRMREWFEWIMDCGEYRALRRCGDAAEQFGAPVYVNRKKDGRSPWNDAHAVWPLPNVWLGVSVENQAAADERIPELLRTPAAVRFLSCEPLLGPVDLTRVALRRVDDGTRVEEWEKLDALAGRWSSEKADLPGTWVSRWKDVALSWVIAGCESGPGARPCSVEWLRSLRDQCAAAGVPFFLKQAEYVLDGLREPIKGGPGSGLKGKGARSGRIYELPYLDGVQHAAFPEARNA